VVVALAAEAEAAAVDRDGKNTRVERNLQNRDS